MGIPGEYREYHPLVLQGELGGGVRIVSVPYVKESGGCRGAKAPLSFLCTAGREIALTGVPGHRIANQTAGRGYMLLMPSVDTSSVGVSSSMSESPGVADHYRYIQSGPTRELHHVLSEHLHTQPGTPAPWHPLRVRRLRRRAPPLAASTHVLVA